MTKLNTQQIGKCGELLVQYELLKYGIESAHLTTDPGIDLVAFPNLHTSPTERYKPLTIQVKATTPKDQNNKWLRWDIPEKCPADYIALVDLNRNKFWLLKFEEFKNDIARRAAREMLRIWWYVRGQETSRAKNIEADFKKYESDIAIPRIFNLE